MYLDAPEGWEVPLSELLGLTGTVTVALPGGDGLGEVLLRMAGGTQTFLARSGEALAVDEAVLVVADLGFRVVDVVRWTDPMRWHDAGPGLYGF